MDLAQGLDRAYDVITGIHRHDDAAGSFLDKGLLGLFHSTTVGAPFFTSSKNIAHLRQDIVSPVTPCYSSIPRVPCQEIFRCCMPYFMPFFVYTVPSVSCMPATDPI